MNCLNIETRFACSITGAVTLGVTLITHLCLVPRLRVLELHLHSPIHLHVVSKVSTVLFQLNETK
jgi:hypothetical protein